MLCFIVVFVHDYPLLQITFVVLCCFAMAVYLIVNKPFKFEKQQTTAVIDEFVVAGCCGLFLFFTDKGMSTAKRNELGTIIMAIMLLSTAKNIAIALYYAWQEIKEQIHELFFASDEKSDSPATSELFSDRIEDTPSELKSEVEKLREERKHAEDNNIQFTFNNEDDIAEVNPSLSPTKVG